MKIIRVIVLSAVVLGSGLVSTLGCDAVDAAFDCHDACNRYKDCFDPNFDVNGCMSNCRTKAANDSTVQAQADKCDACIGDKSCLQTTFQCPDCAAIIAKSAP